jgi:hypothetical protein
MSQISIHRGDNLMTNKMMPPKFFQSTIQPWKQHLNRSPFIFFWVSLALLITSAALANGMTYTVQSGDNLTKIAAKFGTSVSALVELNKAQYPCLASSPTCLQAGWVIQVPLATQTSNNTDSSIYTVQSGDSLHRIAAKTGTPYQTLVDLNKPQYPCLATKPSCLQVGWTLRLGQGGPAPHCIYVGQTLCSGYDMGVDDSGRRRTWVTDMKGSMKMAYPSGLNWGAVFITVGKPVDPPRPGQDLSAYRTLSLELRGQRGGEQVNIGVKDNTDPDNGTETKFLASNLTTSWRTYTFTLSNFTTADLTRLYVVIEFVFEPGWPAQTVYFRNINYLP